MSGKLIIRISHEQPLPLADIAEMFVGISKEFKKFMSTKYGIKDASLSLQAVRTGSQVYEIVPFIPVAATLIENFDAANTVYDFLKNLRSSMTILLDRVMPVGKQSLGTIGDNSSTYRNIQKIIRPAANGDAVQLNIAGDLKVKNISLVVGSEEARQVVAMLASPKEKTRASSRHLREIEESVKTIGTATHSIIKKGKAFYWNQNPDVFDLAKGTIESIWDEPLQVGMTQAVRDEMLQSGEDPMEYVYFVEVEVETYMRIPIRYNIVRIDSKQALR